MFEEDDFSVPNTDQSMNFFQKQARLVGDSDSVNELTNILRDCQINQVTEVLSLPHPELVTFFHQILDLIAVKPTNLTFDFTVNPNPCVAVTGAHWEVEKFKQALNYNNPTLKTLVFEGPGAQRYFQAEGKVSKEMIESSSKVIVKVLQGVEPLNVGTEAQSSITMHGSLKRQQQEAGTNVLANNKRKKLCEWDVNQNMDLSRNQGDQASWSSSKDVIVTVGNGVKLQLVCGDITKETTDAVVNSTNFRDLNSGVCKAILSVVGPQVKKQLKTAKVTKGSVFFTPPGMFPCKAILHVDGKDNLDVLETLVCHILQHCEFSGYESVAIPAIWTGAAGMDPDVIAYSILQTIKAFASSKSLFCLSNIRLVLKEREVFLAFKDQLMQMFPHTVNNTEVSAQEQYPQVNMSTGILCSGSASQQSVFLVLGLCSEDANVATRKLTDVYQAHSTTKTFTWEDLVSLDQDDMEDLKELLEREGLFVEEDKTGKGGLKVSGLKEGVNRVVQMIQTIATLRKKMKSRSDENVDVHVTWCIWGQKGEWERLPKRAIHDLESGRKDIVDGQGLWWSADLQIMEAKSHATGQTRKLKRLQDRTDFKLPLYWDDMATNENLKVVTLETSSEEFCQVCNALRKRVPNSVLKIERLQNVYLRRAYELQKEYISEKNKLRGGACEQQLYHGTSLDNSYAIMNNGFNRSFCGKNATVWGKGTYFAVDAFYSSIYADPADDGSRCMFLTRVLTGSYTQGSSNMKVPPRRKRQPSLERYDSVVDNMMNPQIYVIFNDYQAYPDYRITFH